MPAVPLSQVAVHLRPEDNVAVAARPLHPVRNTSSTATRLHAQRRIGLGHKVAVRPIAQGRGGSQVRPDHRLRQRGHRRRAITSTSTTSRPTPSSATTPFAATVRRRRPRARAASPGSWATTAATAATARAITSPSSAPSTARPAPASTSPSASARPTCCSNIRTSTASSPSRTRPAAPCSTTAPTTISSTARWPASPSIPTSRRTSSSASAARRDRRSTWSRIEGLIQLERLRRKQPLGAQHPGMRRHRARRSRPACKAIAELLPQVNDVRRTTAARPSKLDPGHELRRLRRQLRRHGQPGPRRRRRPARRPGRHEHPRRNARDLRGRAPADPPGRQPRGRREAGRADQVVGVVHRHLRRRDQQQSLARQQGRRPDDDLRKVARRHRQGRQHRPGRRGRLRRAGDGRRASSSWTRPATIR